MRSALVLPILHRLALSYDVHALCSTSHDQVKSTAATQLSNRFAVVFSTFYYAHTSNHRRKQLKHANKCDQKRQRPPRSNNPQRARVRPQPSFGTKWMGTPCSPNRSRSAFAISRSRGGVKFAARVQNSRKVGGLLPVCTMYLRQRVMNRRINEQHSRRPLT